MSKIITPFQVEFKFEQSSVDRKVTVVGEYYFEEEKLYVKSIGHWLSENGKETTYVPEKSEAANLEKAVASEIFASKKGGSRDATDVQPS